jgi:4-amino-4-deoxy-L-arabinose transferase-like glycosyltransferase
LVSLVLFENVLSVALTSLLTLINAFLVVSALASHLPLLFEAVLFLALLFGVALLLAVRCAVALALPMPLAVALLTTRRFSTELPLAADLDDELDELDELDEPLDLDELEEDESGEYGLLG